MKDYRYLFITLVVVQLLLFCRPSLAQSTTGLRFFAEAYDETIYQRREDRNTITMAQFYEGIRQPISGLGKWDVYAKIRYGNDANKDFWNNRFETMIGTRLRFFEKLYLAVYSEYVRGEYINDQSAIMSYSPSYEDWRYGMIFWHGWDPGAEQTEKLLPVTIWSEVYSDVNYLDKDDQNYIYYLEAKLGLQLLRWQKVRLDVYGVVYAYYDRNADFWNNHAAAAPGIRLTPWSDIDLSLRCEYLWGQYHDRVGRYENPYDRVYQDLRIGLFFWHGWGE